MSMINGRHDSAQRGFTLIELLVAMVISLVVVGGAALVTSQVQASYTRSLEEAAAEQEGRYALEWVSRLIRAAANNPYSLPTGAMPTSDCPAANTAFSWLIMDPDLDTINDDIRIQTDSNPPDGLLGGTAGNCNQANEDVTISYSDVNRSITFLDNNLGGTASVRTDAVIDDLTFIFRDVNRNVTTVPANVIFVETQVRVRTRTLNPATGLPYTRTLTQEVRIRGRNCC
jgi:prepilin-type N-terminal cleavage/methylation domain-containing protein